MLYGPTNPNVNDPSSFVCGECGSAAPPPSPTMSMHDNNSNLKRLSLNIDRGAVPLIKLIPSVVNVTAEECQSNCIVTIEYNVTPNQREQQTDREMNPQEAKENSQDGMATEILNRLTEKGFSFTVVDNPESASNSQQQEPIDASTQHTVRTRLHITSGLCCPTETPIIKSLLKPLDGVVKIGVNVATKVAWIDHTDVISAKEMQEVLIRGKFGVDILKDGNAAANTAIGNNAFVKESRSNFVESTLLLNGDTGMLTVKSKDTIERIIRQQYDKNEIRALHLNIPSRTLKVEHDPELVDAETIGQMLTDELTNNSHDRQQLHKWTVKLLHDGAVEGLTLPVLAETAKDDTNSNLVDHMGICSGLRLNIIISGIFWIISLISAIDEELDYLKYAGIISVVSGMPPVLIKACHTVRRFQFDANCMMVIAAFGALALGEYDEAASVAFVFSISEWLESQATGKARKALGEIVSLRPEYAHVLDEKSGEITIIPAENVPLGSLCSVRTGDKVPADGIVIEGSSSLDESSITGEARPVDKVAGDEVCAGAINVGSTQLVIKTTSTVEDSTLSRLIALVEEAQTNRSETEKIVDSFAKKYTPFVLGTALLVCTVPWVFGAEIGRYWTLNGLIIIVIACPCALTISTPVTYSAGLAATAKRGIIIKGGSRLEVSKPYFS